MRVAPARDWNVFQQIFAEHWDGFKHAHPRYQTAYYDDLSGFLGRVDELFDENPCRNQMNQSQKGPHSPGFRGRRSASKGEGRSRHDFLLLHAVGSSDQLQNNANNIKGLAFYHAIRWSLANPDIVGRRIRKLRLAHGFTQMEMADKADIPQSTLSEVESGVRQGSGITLRAACRLAFALGVSLDALAGTPADEREDEYEPAAEDLVPA
jgi:DNA-binding XRE family transcriptional regulator